MFRTPVFVAIAFCCATAVAEDAKQFFESVYGNKIKQAKATTDCADDIALAKEILAAAQTIDSPDVLAVMCDNAADLSQRHADGMGVAIDALKLLADKVESRRVDARKKLVEVLTRQSLTGEADARADAADELIALLILQGDDAAKAGKPDEASAGYRQALVAAQRHKSDEVEAIKAKIDAMGLRSRTEKQIARLREKLLANANDSASAEEIIRLYVVDMDSPTEAVKFIGRAKDAKLIKLVPLAAKAQSEVAETELLGLGTWYFDLATTAASSSKLAMWQRASGYLTRYRESQAVDDLGRTKAELMLKSVAADRAKADPKGVPEESWISKAATYKTSSDASPPRPDLLTGGEEGFAFHTKDGEKNNFIIIDLGKPMLISRIWIENRRDPQNYGRAKDMTVSFSNQPAQKFKTVWTAEKGDPEWTIQLPRSEKARYIMIKQAEAHAGRGFHLAQVKVFGWEN